MKKLYQASQKLEDRSFLVFLLLTSLAFISVLRPFAGTLFWACAVAIIFYPLYQKCLQWFNGRSSLSAFSTLLLSVVMVIIPIALLLSAAADEGQALYDNLRDNTFKPAEFVESFRAKFPGVEQFLVDLGFDFQSLNAKVNELAISAGRFLAENVLTVGKNTAEFLLNLSLMLYVAFFLLRDGERLVSLIILALPLGDTRERLLFTKFAEVTRATVKGNLVVAMVQGAMGGFIFWCLDLNAPVMWGFVMAIASLVPAVGAALVWAPFALYLFVTSDVTSGIILTLFGACVIGVADNVLRPILVGRDTKLPDYLVLISTLGGIALVGINGFVIGPLIAALFIASWGIFIREFQESKESGE